MKIQLERREYVINCVACMQFVGFCLSMWLVPLLLIVAFRTGAYVQWSLYAVVSAALAILIGYSAKSVLSSLESRLYKPRNR